MQRSGFTLIEVMLVIVIVGLLVGVTAPHLKGVYEEVAIKETINLIEQAEKTK